jgi:hypothetical protein
MTKTYKFDQYVEEARTDPFRLEANGSVIEISAPTSETMLKMDFTTSPRTALRLLCGNVFEDVYELLAPQPASVLNRLLADMMGHFGADQVPPAAGFGSSI